MPRYNDCVECGERAYRPQHAAWRVRRGEGHPFVDPRRQTIAPPIRTVTRDQALREGFVEVQDVTALPATVEPHVGDEAIVYARGDLRMGLISKIGRTTIYVSVATPTSPDLVTQGRIGGAYRQRGYLREVKA